MRGVDRLVGLEVALLGGAVEVGGNREDAEELQQFAEAVGLFVPVEVYLRLGDARGA